MPVIRLIVLVIFLIYSKPLLLYRYRFRSAVYKDKRFSINFQPRFWKEIRALFTDKEFETEEEKRTANFYRRYLALYAVLLLLLLRGPF